ncbi:dickkopf-related protein 3a isoform X1 [Entelurus aequoreus]|uniref:dickkopf-related protein 3a isoform X1 n=1 Tax=Entelurus aequoreus TaxID=161455 RepID=UPI002B1DC0D7|nr:dickkopf-related protein 3a isoform X1 [Entelurus aequoreus]XP_061884497.1 dickkopf-related protein 3a isoform X1 [Entelurus aequoreus]
MVTMRMKMLTATTMQVPVLLLLTLLTTCNGILPDTVDSGISHILDNSIPEDHILVQREQLDHDEQLETEQQEKSIATTTVPDTEPDNHIDTGCVTTEDCGKGRYCLLEKHNSKCQACKDTDVPCAKDEECCDTQLCVWGQCSPNATKGHAGSTCQHQDHCSQDLCCAFHSALLFPVCSAKPIERERCFPASNQLTADKSPKKHCPCAGDLHCQHLGRGSMCLQAVHSSEEDLTDSLYSAIDYVL